MNLDGEVQESWEKYYSLVPLKLWNCNPHVIRGKFKLSIYFIITWTMLKIMAQVLLSVDEGGKL